MALVEVGKADGVGFALCPPYVGVDLDSELSPAEREAIVFSLVPYTEDSVSGEGAHVVLKASLNGGRHPTGFGVFQWGRFFYFSGEHWPETPTTIEERQAELDQNGLETLGGERDWTLRRRQRMSPSRLTTG